MSYLPCENPNCKSHGKPHPNCRCHPGMAKGGVVEYFCATNKAHKKDCQFFAKGGEVVPAEMLPADLEVVPDDMLPEELKESDASVVPDDMLPAELSEVSKEEKYSTPKHKLLTAVEGASQGVLGPLAAAAELGLGKMFAGQIDPNFFPTKEDMAARQTVNAPEHAAGEAAGLVGSTLYGVGLGSMAAKVGEKFASTFLKNAIPAIAVTSSDEVTKAMLGVGDPNDAAANALVSGAFGGTVGVTLKGMGKAAGKIGTKLFGSGEIELGTSVQRFMKGIGAAHAESQGHGTLFADDAAAGISKSPFAKTVDDIGTKAYEAGKKFYTKFSTPHQLTAEGVIKAGAKGAGLGSVTGGGMGSLDDVVGVFQQFVNILDAGLTGASTGAVIGAGREVLKSGTTQVSSRATKSGAAAILKVMSEADGNVVPQGIADVMNYAKNVDKGAKMITDGVNKFFIQPTTQQSKGVDISKAKETLKKYIENGGIYQNIQEQQIQDNQQPEEQEFAEGGLVTQKKTPLQKGDVQPLLDDNPVQRYFPSQDMILQGAKVRVSNYLTSIQPNKNAPRLPFDRKPDQKQKEKNFDNALTIAVNPLSVLEKIQSGRLTKNDMAHFNSMYPEMKTHLQKQITKRIVDAQMKGEKPNRQVKQSLSFFMGAPLESTMKQPMLAAAQATFAKNKPDENKPEQPVKKKGTSVLGKAPEQYKTASDAGVARTQTSKL